MPWPAWLSPWTSDNPSDDHDSTTGHIATSRPPDRTSSASQYASPRIILPSLLLTAASLGSFRLYKRYLRRIPSVAHIKPSDYRKRSLRGYCTSVGDGDNFRFYHTPGGVWAGWGWAPGRRSHIVKRASAGPSPALPKEIRDATLHVRIAGVDAPELAHFGRPAQPFGDEALTFLKSQVLGRNVRVKIWRPDQYGRVVGSVHVRAWTGFWQDVGLQMLKSGMATVYEAKFGSEFGGQEQAYHEAEKRAKERRVGMWAGLDSRATASSLLSWLAGHKNESKEPESPRQYKERMKELDAAKAIKK